jgi:NitT/TauT family transport system ATP-binding protein
MTGAAEQAEGIIAIEHVTKSFATKRRATAVLRDVSLSVVPGEFVSLLGPSGCGKTTLLNLVAGFAAPDSGSVKYAGERITRPNSKVGYLTQDDALLPWRNVRANVALPLQIKGVDRAQRAADADRLLGRVGLRGFEDHYPHQLSGGMRKRVGLARTLIYHPQTLLLDEPFGALDAQTRVLMQRELLSLVRSLQLTVLLVTHDLNEAIGLSDRIVLFSRRPASILEVYRLPRRAPEEIDGHGSRDDTVYAAIWERLSRELDPPGVDT